MKTVMISYPRSGLNWWRFMFFELHRILYPNRKKYHEKDRFFKINHDSMGLGPGTNRRRQNSRRWIGKIVIFNFRDPRDIILSNYYRVVEFQKFDERTLKRKLNIDSFFREPYWGIQRICTWATWFAENKDKFERFLFTTYENRHSDLSNEIKKVCNFLRLEVTEKHVQRMIEAGQFSKMKAMEEARGRLLPDLNRNPAMPNSSIVRVGKVGTWKKVLPPSTAEYATEIMSKHLYRPWFELYE